MNPYDSPDSWFRIVVEAAPNAMLVVDEQHQIVLVNLKTEEVFGFSRGELLGSSVEVLIPERFRAQHRNDVSQFFATPLVRPMGARRELFGRRRDGSELEIEIGLNPIATPSGLFTLASIIDVTERRRADERFRLVVEAAPNAMLLVDQAGQIAMLNRAAEELFGYDRTELTSQSIQILIPERFRKQHPTLLEGFFREPRPRPIGGNRELCGRRKDGTEVPIEIGLNPISTPEGFFTLAAIIDISERKRAETAMERLAAIVEGSEDAILSRTLDGSITSWNAGAERLYGYTAAEAIGRPASMLVPEHLRAEDRTTVDQIRRHGRSDHFESKRRRKDGSEVDVSISISPIRNAQGDLVGESKIARDITNSKRQEAELQRSNAELEQFAYVASHDLQEPLRMVANYSELLAQRYQGKLDEKADKYIHYAVDGARRMQRLVCDLLAYSRVGSQGKPLVSVASESVLADVLHSLGPKIRDCGAEISREDLPEVMADEGQLHQLFQNLIGNALKFRNSAPPKVSISAVSKGALWQFGIADNGIGIETKYCERIFQMFQRLHELGKYEGSGIGLSISKRIVERHGGRLWFESEPGQGTTFFFTLRAAKQGHGS